MRVLAAFEDGIGLKAITSRLIAQLQPGAEVRLLHVIESFPLALGERLGTREHPDFAAARAQQRSDACALMDSAAAALHAAGFAHVTFRTPDGDVPATILDEAEMWACDLIMIGADHRTAFRRLLHGSVTDAIAHEASCAVEIVPVALDTAP